MSRTHKLGTSRTKDASENNVLTSYNYMVTGSVQRIRLLIMSLRNGYSVLAMSNSEQQTTKKQDLNAFASKLKTIKTLIWCLSFCQFLRTGS